jgi:hypothetical protein
MAIETVTVVASLISEVDVEFDRVIALLVICLSLIAFSLINLIKLDPLLPHFSVNSLYLNDLPHKEMTLWGRQQMLIGFLIKAYTTHFLSKNLLIPP